MRFEDLVSLVGDQPFFDTGLLLAGDVDPNDVRRQLSRWTRSGKIHQLRRGLYTLAPPYNKLTPHSFLVANALVPGSYVSGTSALAYYGLTRTPAVIARLLQGLIWSSTYAAYLAPVARVRDLHRVQLVLKAAERPVIERALAEALPKVRLKKSVVFSYAPFREP